MESMNISLKIPVYNEKIEIHRGLIGIKRFKKIIKILPFLFKKTKSYSMRNFEIKTWEVNQFTFKNLNEIRSFVKEIKNTNERLTSGGVFIIENGDKFILPSETLFKAITKLLVLGSTDLSTISAKEIALNFLTKTGNSVTTTMNHFSEFQIISLLIECASEFKPRYIIIESSKIRNLKEEISKKHLPFKSTFLIVTIE